MNHRRVKRKEKLKILKGLPVVVNQNFDGPFRRFGDQIGVFRKYNRKTG
jgi:hypothetical protein